MHDFRSEHESCADKYESRENACRNKTINNSKILKIDLMKVIRFSMKGMRKEQKKTGTKKIDRGKRKKFRFFITR